VPWRLPLVEAKVESREVLALLDSAAVPNNMSERMAIQRRLEPKPTKMNITVANGAVSNSAGVLTRVNNAFAEIKVGVDVTLGRPLAINYNQNMIYF
jgi:hypothetical protein